MPKTPSNKLYKLIKSLSGPEKRYFKLFARTPTAEKNPASTSSSLKPLMLRKPTMTKSSSQSIYAGEPIQSRKYSELKAYLYELILKALQGYDENSSIDFRLKRMLQSVRVLYRRSHYDDAIELLQKAKKLASPVRGLRLRPGDPALEKTGSLCQIGYSLPGSKPLPASNRMKKITWKSSKTSRPIKTFSTAS